MHGVCVSYSRLGKTAVNSDGGNAPKSVLLTQISFRAKLRLCSHYTGSL